ncbi:MAG: class I SAM-dependent methyltransferase [Opitutales bacterium]|jgi:ubiquinone/menaquinone biosynthesis C-methylase UbiE|nr:class I SAM-dependent methyltransferase [Opitutales bacterium]MDG2166311.1 class I SAM-dependent methyltransferase [Opitutales bacterium]
MSVTSSPISSAFKEVESLYEDLGKKQAFWAAMTYPEYLDDQNEDAFFESGKAEVDAQIHRLSELNFSVNKGRCLDFGCGVGRLTNALAQHFEEAVGVDVSSTMIDRANEIKRASNTAFVLNKREDLAQLKSDTFDFVYSNKTIQHIPYPASKNYIKDFFRALKPGGLAVFLVHDCKHTEEGSLQFNFAKWYREKARPFVKRLRGKPPVQIHPISKTNIEKFVHDAGGEILHCETDNSYTRRKRGNLRTWYWARKRS